MNANKSRFTRIKALICENLRELKQLRFSNFSHYSLLLVMKKIILQLIYLFAFCALSYAQTKPAGVPEYNPDSPIFRSYSIVRDEVSSTKNVLKTWGDKNVEISNDDANRYLKKAKEALAKLQADPTEAKKEYVKFYATELANLEAQRKEKYESFGIDESYSKKVDEYFNFALNDIPIQDASLAPSYTGYYTFRKEFETKRPEKFKDNYIQGRISRIDNFFKVEVYKMVPEWDKEVDKIIAEIHEINQRGEESYLLNAKNYLKNFDRSIEAVTYLSKYLLEDKTSINAVQAKIDKEKAMLNEYINSGKYDAHTAQYRQEIIDAVRLGAERMNNDVYEKMAIAGVTKGKVARVSITTDNWYVAKNEYGFPLYKYLHVDLAITEVDGKCWLTDGQIRKTYEGGGQYGDEFFFYWGIQSEMNCGNINK